MTVIAMSRTEIDRMSVWQDLAANRITVTEAATLMRLGGRQVFRLAKASLPPTCTAGPPSLTRATSLWQKRHATSALPRITVCRTSKPSNCGCSR
jgi:hypothetical protein